MSFLHRVLFPHCTLAEVDRLRAELAAVTAERDAVKKDLKAETNWNRKLADRMVNFGLMKSNQFGIPPREVGEEPKPSATQELTAETSQSSPDALKEAQIQARVLELEEIYRQRGRNVPQALIRETVEKNFVYLMDDDRVEMDGY